MRWQFIVAAALLVLLSVTGAVAPLDRGMAGLRAQVLQRPASTDIVVVEIDSRSLQADPQWPWPRMRYARAIENLHRAGASLIGFDVDFSARSTPQDDAVLRSAIAGAEGSIALPVFMQRDGGGLNSPLASLAENALLASVNIPLDSDGVVRTYNRNFETPDGRSMPSIAALLSGAPYGASGQFRIDYGIDVASIPRLSFNDIYLGRFDPALVRGKSVLIGATALELGDEFVTPRIAGLSGVYIHALAYESLVQGRALNSLRGAIMLGLALLLMLALWPRDNLADLPRFFLRHALVLTATFALPFMVQAALPVSLDFGLIYAAQAVCVFVALRREFKRREQELILQREAHLSFVALHDPETSLPNRRAMLEALVTTIGAARASGGVVGAAAIGIDRFAVLRGAIGYVNANEVVARLAENLRQSSAQSEVFHISTSILGLVVKAASEPEARAFLIEAVERLNREAAIGDQIVEAQIRAGFCIEEGAAPEKILEEASLALDQARVNHRPWVFYSVEDAADPKVQLALVSDVAPGLKRGEFFLMYQAKARLSDGLIIGAEALIRWRHPIHGPISPDRFIGVAEETGAIHDLTRWVVENAIRDQARLSEGGAKPMLAVNISGRCLSDVEFCAFVVEAVQSSGACLSLEITETALIDDPLIAISTLSAFRAAGIKISIDDYGAGLSSLSYLKTLAADELKLDRSLLADILQNARDKIIIKSTIELAHSLGMSVVAEGVEDTETARLLADMDCDLVQGYLVSKPLPLEAFQDLQKRSAETRAIWRERRVA